VPTERHGAFSVAAQLNRSVYQHGDDAEIRVTPSQDAYLYIFGVSEDSSASLLLLRSPVNSVSHFTEFLMMILEKNHLRDGKEKGETKRL